MRYHPLHCWDCGVQVIGGEHGKFVHLSNMVEVRFHLVDGSYCESPFCQSCAAKPWTSERILEFERAVNAVYPEKHTIRIHSVGPVVVRRDPIMGIVDMTHSIQGEPKEQV